MGQSYPRLLPELEAIIHKNTRLAVAQIQHLYKQYCILANSPSEFYITPETLRKIKNMRENPMREGIIDAVKNMDHGYKAFKSSGHKELIFQFFKIESKKELVDPDRIYFYQWHRS